MRRVEGEEGEEVMGGRHIALTGEMTCSFTASLPQSASSLAIIVLLRKRIFSRGSFLPSTSIICMSSCKPHDSNSSRAWRRGEEEGGRKSGGGGGREEEWWGRREGGRAVGEKGRRKSGGGGGKEEEWWRRRGGGEEGRRKSGGKEGRRGGGKEEEWREGGEEGRREGGRVVGGGLDVRMHQG